MRNILTFTLVALLSISCNKGHKSEDKKQESKQVPEQKQTSCDIEKKRIETEPTILGMDISHFQDNIEWDKIKADGVNFVYLKATQGTHFKDPKFKEHHEATKNECLYRGAYHFYETGKDAKEQAQNFVEAVGALIPGDLPPVLDLEELGVKKSVDLETYATNTLLWLKIVEEKLGVRPIIYCDPAFGNSYLKHADFANYKLWVADYTKASAPKVPDTWKDKGWIVWQRTDRKKLEGAEGQIDYDLFHGDATTFLKMVKK